MIFFLNLRKELVRFPNFWGLFVPADSSDNGHFLMIIVRGRPELRSISVRRPIQHERVHRPWNPATPFENLLVTLPNRALDPGVHVSDGDVCHGLGQFTQWTRQIETFILCMDAAAGHDTVASGLLGIGSLPALRPLVRRVHVDTLVSSDPTSFHSDGPTCLQILA
jgi:hypothetical protein